MTGSDPTADSAQPPSNSAAPGRGLGLKGRLLMILKILQVRLRFVIVLGLAFLVVGQWGALRSACDRLIDWVRGAPALHGGVSADTEYFCPMDPGVISDWPTICPVCNMDLVRRKKGTAAILPEGVTARMQLSPYRIQLAGIRTTAVALRPLVREIRLAGLLQEPTVGSHESQVSKSVSERDSTKPDFLLEAEVSDSDIRFLASGRTAELTAAAFPDGPVFTGSVTAGAGAARGFPAASVGTESDLPTAPPLRARPSRLTIEMNVFDSKGLLRAGMFVRAVFQVPLTEIEPFRSMNSKAESGEVLAVPETAVIQTGQRQVVYVETMPGMFDGVEVVLGPRCGEFYPVVRGLTPGWKVATTGAFLIDAETRLNPSLAAGYFGASHGKAAAPASSPPAPPLNSSPAAKPATPQAKLSPSDAALAARQKLCPVTGLPLNSMGEPYPVLVANRKVFLCCKGCEAKLLKEPQKYLEKLNR